MRAWEGTITNRGQVTLPVEIRRRLGLKPGDRVRVALRDGEIRLIPAPSRIRAGYGAIQPRTVPEDFAAVRAELEIGVAEDVLGEL